MHQTQKQFTVLFLKAHRFTILDNINLFKKYISFIRIIGHGPSIQGVLFVIFVY